MKKRKMLALLATGIKCFATACGGFAPPAEEGNSEAHPSEEEIGVSAAVEAFNKAYKGKIKCDADYVAFNDVFETL